MSSLMNGQFAKQNLHQQTNFGIGLMVWSWDPRGEAGEGRWRCREKESGWHIAFLHFEKRMCSWADLSGEGGVACWRGHETRGWRLLVKGRWRWWQRREERRKAWTLEAAAPGARPTKPQSADQGGLPRVTWAPGEPMAQREKRIQGWVSSMLWERRTELEARAQQWRTTTTTQGEQGPHSLLERLLMLPMDRFNLSFFWQLDKLIKSYIKCSAENFSMNNFPDNWRRVQGTSWFTRVEAAQLWWRWSRRWSSTTLQANSK